MDNPVGLLVLEISRVSDDSTVGSFVLKGSSVLNDSKGRFVLEAVSENPNEIFVALECSTVPAGSDRGSVFARVAWVSEDSSDEVVLEAMTPTVLVEGVLELL